MRAFAVMLLVAATAGCFAAPGSDGVPAVCPAPCERTVDDSPDRAFEPSAAVDPRDARNLVVASTVFHDDQSAGSPARFKVHTSSDGGASWQTVNLADVTPATHVTRQYTIFADPIVVWLPDGGVLLFGMGGTGTPAEPAGAVGFTSFDLWSARSSDGGKTWPQGQVIAEGSGFMSASSAGHYHDQPFVAVARDGSLLLAWIVVFNDPDGSVRSDVITSRSRDAGATWSPPVTAAAGRWHNARPAALPDGTLLVAFRDYTTDGPARPVHVARSVDDGASWHEVGTFDASSFARPSFATAGDVAVLGLAEPRGADAFDVTLWSTRDGASWDRRVLATAAALDESLVTVAGARDGAVWVTWHAPQDDGSNAYWVWTQSASAEVATQRIDATRIGANGPSGILGWASLGDYHGLAATDAGAFAAWISGEASGQDVRGAWFPHRV